MAWTDFQNAGPSIPLLSRSLERGRLGHAYLLAGETPALLERVAAELAAAVNCQQPAARSEAGDPAAACGACSSCRRIREGLHPDVHWLRAESKMRIIRVEQVRELIHAVQLKPSEARYKVGIIVGADRLNPQSANAFLKTLEEPPSRSLLILLSTEPDRLLTTILSRCLRLGFPGGGGVEAADLEWMKGLVADLSPAPASYLARYRLLDSLLRRLSALREEIEADVEARSPEHQYADADPELREQWEEEGKASVEAEYRRRRGQTLQALQWWMRDVWLLTLGQTRSLLAVPQLETEAQNFAGRLTEDRALKNLHLIEETQSLLHTNVQEALALEVAMLRLEL